MLISDCRAHCRQWASYRPPIGPSFDRLLHRISPRITRSRLRQGRAPRTSSRRDDIVIILSIDISYECYGALEAMYWHVKSGMIYLGESERSESIGVIAALHSVHALNKLTSL